MKTLPEASQTRELLREKLGGCIQTGDITLASGKKTDFYFDGRLVTLEPEGSVLIAQLMLEEISSRGIGAVGGLTSGADPLTSSIGVLAWNASYDVNLFFVRKERKAHGMQRRVEGPPIPDGVRIGLVDDVLTSGGSLLQAADAIEEEIGRAPDFASVIVDREEGGEAALKARGIELCPLFRKSDFR